MSMTFCPHCGRHLAGQRFDHPELCLQAQALRRNEPVSIQPPRASAPPRVRMTEAELNDYLDGKLTRAEIATAHQPAA